MFADVIVDIAHSQVDKIFEYKIGCDGVFVGSRVRVPFGKYFVEGIVIKVKETSEYPLEKIKEISSVLEETPALTNETLAMADYITSNCYVTKAAALRLFLPIEMRKGKVREQFTKIISLADGINVDETILTLRKSAVKQRDLLFFLSEEGEQTLTILNEKFGNGAVKTLLSKGVLLERLEKRFRSPYKELNANRKQIELTEKQKL